MLRELVRDSLRYLPAQVIPSAVSVIGTFIFTRLLSTSDYGIYTLIMALATLIAGVGFGWITFSAVRYYGRYEAEERLNEFFSSGIAVLLIEAMIGGVVLIAFAGLNPANTAAGAAKLVVMAASLITGVSMAFKNWSLNIIRARRAVTHFALLTSVSRVGFLLISLLLLWGASNSYVWLVVSTIAMDAVIIIAELIRMFPKHLRVAAVSWGSVRQFWSYGAPLVVVTLGDNVLSSSDRFFLGYYHSTAEVGHYSAIYSIASTSIIALFSILKLSVVPILIQSYEQTTEQQMPLLLQQALSLFLIIMLPAVVGLSLLAPEISLLLGEDFRQSSTIILPLVSGGVFFMGLAQYFNISMELTEKTSSLAAIWGISIVAHLLMNWVLIPVYGVIGAAASTLISYAVYALIDWLVVRNKVLHWRFPVKTLLKVTVACGIMSIPLLLPLPAFSLTISLVILLVKILVSGLVYALTLLFLKESVIRELWALRSISR